MVGMETEKISKRYLRDCEENCEILVTGGDLKEGVDFMRFSRKSVT